MSGLPHRITLPPALVDDQATGAIAGYAADLTRDHGAGPAYAAVKELCLARAGKHPPWGAMPDLLRRMARDAGADRDADDDEVVAAYVAAGTMRDASMAVWRAYRAAVVRVARADPAVRGWLAGLDRDLGVATGAGTWWLDLLFDSGAAGTAAALPPAERASWLGRLIHRLSDAGPRRYAATGEVPPRFGELVDLLAPDLPAVPDVYDIRFVALLLERGVAVTPVRRGRGAYLELAGWLRDAAEARADLSAVAGHPQFGPVLATVFEQLLARDGQWQQVLAAAPALRPLAEAKHDRQLAEPVRALAERPLPELHQPLRQIDALIAAGVPDGFVAGLTAIDLARPLGALLRAGVVDEFGWPALEEAAGRLGTEATASGAWPDLVLADRGTALLVGRDGILAEYALPTLDADPRPPALVHTGGELLLWRPRASRWVKSLACWRSNPGDVFEADGSDRWLRAITLALPDGTRTAGGAALRPGDRALPSAAVCFGDGSRWWRVVDWQRVEVERFDPVTGGGLGAELPPFLAEYRDAGATLDVFFSWFAPLGHPDSPLGVRDGLAGFRLRRRVTDAGKWIEAESIDGARYEGPPVPNPQALVRWPGDNAPRLLGAGHIQSDPAVHLAAADGTLFARVRAGRQPAPEAGPSSGWLPADGTPFVPPPVFWHHLRVRDRAGSAALRAVTDDAAGALLAAAVTDLHAGRNELSAAAEALGAHLPEVTHPGLRAGLLGTLRYAAGLRIQLDDAIAKAGGGAVAPVDEGLAMAGLWGTGLDRHAAVEHRVHHPEGPRRELAGYAVPGRLGTQLDTAEAFFTGRLDNVNEALMPMTELPWPLLVGCAGAVARRAVSTVVTDAERAALLDLLDRWAATPFAADPGAYRVGTARGDLDAATVTPTGRCLRVTAGRARYDGDDRQATLWIATGDAAPEATGGGYTWPRPWGTAERIRRFTALARQRGPVPWDPEAAGRLAERTGLDRAAAAMLLATFPFVHVGELKGSYRVHPPEFATAAGVGQDDLEAAARVFADIPVEQRMAVLDEAMPDDPEELWLGAGALVDRLADAWCARLGREVPITAELLAAAPAVGHVDPARTLRAIAWPERSPLLSAPTRTTLELLQGHTGLFYVLKADRRPALDEYHLSSLNQCLAWIYGELPAGNPIRMALPGALEALRARLDDDELLVSAGLLREEDAAGIAAMTRIAGAVEVESWPPPAPLDGASVIVLHRPPNDSSRYLKVILRPARLSSRDLGTAAAVLGSYSAVHSLVRLTGDGFTAIAERVATAVLPPDGYEKNPALSVPDLVAEVAARLGVAPDPAALYLQLLALPDPTDQNVQRWNGWTPARRKRAATALRDAGQVTEEKRPRARRTAFIQGEWRPSASGPLPMEAYKPALYGDVRNPWTAPELFEEAWRQHGPLTASDS
jgi:hypothetical protein